MPRHRHGLADRHVAKPGLRHEARAQRVRREAAVQSRGRAARLHDEPHTLGAQRRAHAVARQHAPEDRPAGDAGSTARALRIVFFDVGGKDAIVL